ncbi:adenine phosphoribosyltransferase [Subtercola boreus]|uniref:Adenine phosphoribosyltransferase n=2 Tax=Subtercola boreus TaxID=120213 RepID=A0A3E0WA52_9MICO|nr:adenine phosphoribosyltransferase [Subtercola boreus]RFA19953.1 adenine phosphoribosyltransferase [Subtercola boreus]RFA26346.1 adenine phosphoribosyltransferase [Subtercola boreus]
MTTTPDFPKPGILFRDLTALMADGDALRQVTDALLAQIPTDVDALVGVEARGFLFAAAAAVSRGIGVYPIRKEGKLPGPLLSETYSLEYGTATIQLQPESLAQGSRVYVLDDVLATGGTMAAAIRLLERAGYVVVGLGVAIELRGLGGREAVAGYPVHALIELDG